LNKGPVVAAIKLASDYPRKIAGKIAGDIDETRRRSSSLRMLLRRQRRGSRRASFIVFFVLLRGGCAIAVSSASPALRPSIAVHLMNAERDAADIQDWLGRREITSMMIYAAVTNKRRQTKYEEALLFERDCCNRAS
jgi:hypothetical protein